MNEYKIDYCHHDSVTAESRQDYIKREDAIDAVGRVDTAHFKLKGEPMLGACALIDEINDIPSADVIEIGKPYRKEILERYHLEEWIDEEGIIWAKVAKE